MILYFIYREYHYNVVYIKIPFREVKKVIINSRSKIGRRKSILPENDPDMPKQYFWNEQQVADWIEQSGYPHLRVNYLPCIKVNTEIIILTQR